MRLSPVHFLREHYRLVVVGGGTGGCAVASKFSRIMPRAEIAIVEPQTEHFYQPGLTLAAAGLMPFGQLVRPEKSVLPRGVDWFRTGVKRIWPAQNEISLTDGAVLSYDFLVVATGLELRFDLIRGLPSGRQSVLDHPALCSIYFYDGARKTQEELRKFPAGGTALFTFPDTPIKCAGAPQKICYLAEEIFRMRGVRTGSRVVYCTSLGRVFGVPKFADSLMQIVTDRGIELKLRHNIVAVDPPQRVATFELLDDAGKSTGQLWESEFDLLHIGPPCSPVAFLREHAQRDGQHQSNPLTLTDPSGFLRVDPGTLRSPAFPNVFAIGDCANTPNAKTAAAISSQLKALARNLMAAMEGQPPPAKYDGYASCPLVVDRRHVILAEFSPAGPMETFAPLDQSRPSRLAFLLKRYGMPPLYWLFLLKGLWEGPATMRRAFQWMDRLLGKLTGRKRQRKNEKSGGRGN